MKMSISPILVICCSSSRLIGVMGGGGGGGAVSMWPSTMGEGNFLLYHRTMCVCVSVCGCVWGGGVLGNQFRVAMERRQFYGHRRSRRECLAELPVG